MKKAIILLGLSFQDALESRGRMFVYFLLSVINPLYLLMFWLGVNKQQSSLIPGWNPNSITSYYLLLILAGTLLQVHVEEEVAEYDIKEGRLANFLLKPYSYVRLKLLGELPYRLLQSLFSLAIFAGVMLLFPGTLKMSVNLGDLIWVVMIFILAYSISFLLKMTVGILTFWMTDSRGFQEVVTITILICAGFVMPLEFYPHLISQIVHLTPFPYMIYYPVVALQGSIVSRGLVAVIITQLFWIALLTLVYSLLWRKGLKKFTAIGI